MSSFDASQAFRYATDYTLAVPAILGIAPYSVHLITVVNDQVNFDDSANNKVVLTTRLLMADGYRNYSAGDGYLNPMVKQEHGENVVLSNGQLTNNIIYLGPLVLPYILNGVCGGIDPKLFQPALNKNNNIQIYIQLRGQALSPKGNYFQVKELKISDMGGISYIVVLEATNTNPDV